MYKGLKVCVPLRSETETAVQVGIDAGYKFENNIDLAIGYRYLTADFDGVDFINRGVNIGLRYNF
ncbi:porin family protein [Vibrio hippocampi]|uniref:Porin opacity type domain-containing protein n=1 Tax=Vibrio hippocampi TaxID=654686 RepID=A0ABM8ZMT8_9VIBR|nr:porin family protein [Vibrio hippocampi]CAH0529833.1 hypothetical protein VHP8226_03589 [Vibrio hippocampi]